MDIWAPYNDAEKCITAAIHTGGIPVCARSGIMGRTWIQSVIFAFIDQKGNIISNVDFNFGPPRAGIICLSDEKSYVASRIRENGWPYLSNEAALTDILLRRLIRGKEFKPFHIIRSRLIWDTMAPGKRDIWLSDLSMKFGKYVSVEWENILAGIYNSPPCGWFRLRTKMLLYYFKKDPSLIFKGLLDKLFYSIPPRDRERNPAGSKPIFTLLSIIGTDGTGKTTLSKGVSNQIQKFGLKSVWMYFGRVRGGLPGVSVLQRFFSDLFFKNSDPELSLPQDSKYPRSTIENTARWIGSYFYVLDYMTRFVFLVLPKMLKRNIIVFDRYAYDVHLMPSSSSFATWIIDRFMPRPSIICFLDTNIGIIQKRRSERTMRESQRHQNILRNVCLKKFSNRPFINISGNHTLEENIHQLVRASITLSFRKEIKTKKIIKMIMNDIQNKLK